jgi:hypothetical protein
MASLVIGDKEDGANRYLSGFFNRAASLTTSSSFRPETVPEEFPEPVARLSRSMASYRRKCAYAKQSVCFPSV